MKPAPECDSNGYDKGYTTRKLLQIFDFVNSAFVKRSRQPVKNYTSTLIVLTLTLVGLFLYLYVNKSHESYLDSQHALMQQSTRGAARIIELYIRQVRQRVELFAEEESGTISRLSRAPLEEALHAPVEGRRALATATR